MVPEEPTATKVLFPKWTPLSPYEAPEVLEVHEVPSEEVRRVPDQPTATKVSLKTLLVSFKNELLS